MRPSLDSFDSMPTYMRKYLQNYGWHFNKALYEYAVSLMRKDNSKVEPIAKEFVDKILRQYNISLNTKTGEIIVEIPVELGGFERKSVDILLGKDLRRYVENYNTEKELEKIVWE